MYLPKSLPLLLSRISLGGAVLLTTVSSLARPEAPGQIQKVANMDCVPLCTLCHLTNPGEAGNFTKPLGLALVAPIQAQKDITDAYNTWAAANPVAAEKLKQGEEPGSHANVCGPTYGCAVHVAKEAAAPRDFAGPLWVVGAVVAGGLLRRRKSPKSR
jgi:MYXO-CTERM domain-containing protein